MYLRYDENETENIAVDIPVEKPMQPKSEKKKQSKLEMFLTVAFALIFLNYMEAHPEIFEAHIEWVGIGFVILLIIDKLIERPKR